MTSTGTIRDLVTAAEAALAYVESRTTASGDAEVAVLVALERGLGTALGRVRDDLADEAEELNAVDHSFRAGEPARVED